MTSLSLRAALLCISALFLVHSLPAQTNDPQGTSVAPASKVRIVRLSQVKGAVQMDRNTGHGFEGVLANLPIVEHSLLKTGMGVAEIEFEDNSTLRIGPGSMVEFVELDRLAGGATVSSVRLVQGMAYVSLLKTKGNQFNLLFGGKKLALLPASRVRLQVVGAKAELAVLDGMVSVDGSEGPADARKKETVTFELQQQGADPLIAKNIAPQALDEWDKTQASLHAQAGVNAALGSPYSYGQSDMMYYGSFVDAAGCGRVWRPYFASAFWNPYDNGMWAWYQNAGYSWVSPYPWGWTPYHTGNWAYCSGVGWGWQPGGSWNALNNVADGSTYGGSLPTGGGISAGGGSSSGGGGVTTGGGSNPNPRPIPPHPIRPPGAGVPTLVPVNQRPLIRSEATRDAFVFRKDSAGLGVPREGLGRLDKLSHNAVDRGTAVTPIYISGPRSGMRNGRQAGEGGVVINSIHRGYAPDADPRMPNMQQGQGNGSGRGQENGAQQGQGNGVAASAMRSGPSSGGQPMQTMQQPVQPSAPMAQPSGGGNAGQTVHANPN